MGELRPAEEAAHRDAAAAVVGDPRRRGIEHTGPRLRQSNPPVHQPQNVTATGIVTASLAVVESSSAGYATRSAPSWPTNSPSLASSSTMLRLPVPKLGTAIASSTGARLLSPLVSPKRIASLPARRVS